MQRLFIKDADKSAHKGFHKLVREPLQLDMKLLRSYSRRKKLLLI